MMLGVQLCQPCAQLVAQAAQAGLLLSVTADSVIRLLPALILTAAQADDIVAILAPLVKQFLAEHP